MTDQTRSGDAGGADASVTRDRAVDIPPGGGAHAATEVQPRPNDATEPIPPGADGTVTDGTRATATGANLSETEAARGEDQI